jgi:hypothetical protein
MSDHSSVEILSEERLDRIKSIFSDVRESLGIAWVGDLCEELAAYDRYLQAAWYQLKPNVVSAYFRRITRDITRRAFDAAMESGLPFSDHRGELSASIPPASLLALGSLLSAIEAVHPPTLLVATAIRDALLGREVGSSPPRTGPDAVVEEVPRVVPLPRLRPAGRIAEAGSRDADFGPRSYQPFLEQPEYLERARRELRHLVKADAYRRSLSELDVYASAAVRALPFPFRASGELAQSLGYPAASVATLLDLVSNQQSRLCELALQFGALRYAWDGGNLGEQ